MTPKASRFVVRKACGIHEMASRPGGGRTFAPPRRRPHDGAHRASAPTPPPKPRASFAATCAGGRCAPQGGGPASAGPGPRDIPRPHTGCGCGSRSPIAAACSVTLLGRESRSANREPQPRTLPRSRPILHPPEIAPSLDAPALCWPVARGPCPAKYATHVLLKWGLPLLGSRRTKTFCACRTMSLVS